MGDSRSWMRGLGVLASSMRCSSRSKKAKRCAAERRRGSRTLTGMASSCTLCFFYGAHGFFSQSLALPLAVTDFQKVTDFLSIGIPILTRDVAHPSRWAADIMTTHTTTPPTGAGEAACCLSQASTAMTSRRAQGMADCFLFFRSFTSYQLTSITRLTVGVFQRDLDLTADANDTL